MAVIRQTNAENTIISEWTITIVIFGAVFYSILGIFKRFRASMTFKNEGDTSNNVTLVPKVGIYRAFNEESLIIDRNLINNDVPAVPQYNTTILNERMSDMNINSQLKSETNSQFGSNKMLNMTLISEQSTSKDEKPRILKESPDSKAKKKTKKSSKSDKEKKKKKKDKNDKSESIFSLNISKKKESKNQDEKSSKSEADEKKKKDKDKKIKKEKKTEKDKPKKKKGKQSKSLLKEQSKNTLEITNVSAEIPNKNITALNQNSNYTEHNEYEEVSEIPNITFSSNWDMVKIHRQNLQTDVKVQPPATNLREMALQKKANNTQTTNSSKLVQNLSYSSNEESDTNA